MELNISDLELALPFVLREEHSYDPDGWTPENPTYGCCAIVAALIFRRIGGKIVRASLEGSMYEHMRSHFWNINVPNTDGKDTDLTRAQFQYSIPNLENPEVVNIDSILGFKSTLKRYESFEKALFKYLADPLRGDNF